MVRAYGTEMAILVRLADFFKEIWTNQTFVQRQLPETVICILNNLSQKSVSKLGVIEMLEKIEQKVLGGGELTKNDYEHIQVLRERLEDLEDISEGRRNGIKAELFGARASGPSFAIVVGHTYRRQGAFGVAPISENEYPWNKDLAQRIHTQSQAQGVESRIFYRDGVGISGAYRQVKEWGAACVVELHFNAFDGRAHGTETLYDEDRNAGSKAWAQLLQDEMLASLGLSNRGLKERDPGDRGYQSVSALDIPSALIEPFFGDNTTETQIAAAKKDDLALAILNAARAQLAVS